MKLRRRGRVTLEIVKRSDDVRGFKVLPKRWIVERTFGWLGRWRRLSKDYEYLTDTSETMIRLVLIPELPFLTSIRRAGFSTPPGNTRNFKPFRGRG